MKRILFVSLLPLLLLLLTCSPPPFNLAIIESAKLAKQLTFVGQVGPIDSMSINFGSTDVVFLPERDGAGGITTDAGFAYSVDPANGQSVSFIAHDGGNYVREGSPQGLGPLSTDGYPSFLVQAVKSQHKVISFHFDDVVATNNQFGLMTGDPSTHTFTPPSFIPLSPQTMGDFGLISDWVIGVSIAPANFNGFDRAYMLIADTNSGHYFEGKYHLSQNANGLTVPNNIRSMEFDLFGAGVLPFAIPRVLYYYDSSSTYAFAMWKTVPAWTCVEWTESPPGTLVWQPMPGIDHRVDALLTSGDLFSTEGNVGRVYDPTVSTGKLVAQFPLYDLRYVGEAYIGGTPTVLFSQALWSDGQVSFNLYSVPTSDLRKLGE